VYFTNASVRRGLRHRHGTVKESRQSPVRAIAEAPPSTLMTNAGTLSDIGARAESPPSLSSMTQAQSPESLQNVLDYKIAMPTPKPAVLNGAYCRGGACQYRVDPGPPTYPPPLTVMPVPIAMNVLAGREFCRGLSCYKGMGVPGDPRLDPFTLNCVHLFNDIGGGMSGEDSNRNVAQVHDSFERVCKKKVGVLEVASCPAYANTFIGAVAAKVNNPTVGSTTEICHDTYWWMLAFKEAEVALKLTAGALPKGKSLLAGDLNRFGTGGVGPSSARGIKWREYASKHGKWPSAADMPAVPQQLAADGSFASGSSLLQAQSVPTAPKPRLPGADSDEDTPHGLPRYEQNTLPHDEEVHQVPMTKTKYQIAPASADGTIPPVEVAGDLFDYCSNQFSEIMAGYAQTARVTVQLTRDWCTWQAGVSSWIGEKQENGHPDWTHRTCTGMMNLVAFALREDLANTTAGLSAQQVCKQTFLAIGAVHRTDGIIKDAWAQSLRGPPVSGIPAADDDEMQMLLRNAQDHANEIFSKLRNQKADYESMNNVKMAATATLATWNGPELPTQAPWPDLPNAKDMDVTALLAMSVERVRQSKRVGISVVEELKPWGYGS